MLQTAQFPYPGSMALLEGAPVRIHQKIDAETVLVLGDKVTRRALIADLAPPPTLPLLEQWLAECVVPVRDYEAFTPAAEAADHFRAWLEKIGHAESTPLSDYIFIRMMADAGHKPTRGLWRAPHDSQARTRVLFRFVLRSQ